jgi:hypothetical protein
MSTGHILCTASISSKKHKNSSGRTFNDRHSSIGHQQSKSPIMIASVLLLSSKTFDCHAFTVHSRNHAFQQPCRRNVVSFVSDSMTSIKKTKQPRQLKIIDFQSIHPNKRWGMIQSRTNYACLLSMSTSSQATTSSSNEIALAEGKSYYEYDILNRERGILDKYDPSTFETEIYQWWEKSGCFQPDAQNLKKTKTNKKPYVLPMPPPNVTGRLHMGHAIFVALQDILARFHRMRGRSVLWLPGTDHAGIATQLQVEKLLLSEGTSREIVGREIFLKRVWDYKEKQGGFITQQLRSLGASADWSRERFTMDSDLSNAVIEAFVRLHDKGLIYRGEYMVNWAPMLKTAVSDLEVDYTDELGKLYYFKYMIEDSDGKIKLEMYPKQFSPKILCR